MIYEIRIRFENDIVLARQMSREIAGLLGFEVQDWTRIATAASEITRNALNYAGGGKAEFIVEGKPPDQMFQIRISDQGPGIANLSEILNGQYISRKGMGLGILGAKRLMDQFQIESGPGRGTTVLLGKAFPLGAPGVASEDVARIASELDQRAPQSAFEEIQKQNQELLRLLEHVRKREQELAQLNRELEDTNRGVLALYAELQDKAEELHRTNQLKSHFLSSMSHEFRTPLNSIIALSQILLDRLDGDLTGEQEKQVDFIRKGGEELLELVNDLLDLAKIEAGKITVQPSQYDTETLLSGLRGMMRAVHVNPSVDLVFDPPLGIPMLNTDEGKVSQVLRNLLSNALKYTERGEVRVSASVDPELKAVTFSVSDTGIGIASEDQGRIFEEYVQVDTPFIKKAKGTGLGLPLSRKLAQLLGGDLVLTKSQPGVGSTFSAVIPLVYEGEAAEPTPLTPPEEVDPHRFPVLVVEDDRDTMLIYDQYLEESGFQLIPAYSVKEARQVLTQVRPMAIVLDILLPEESGWTFLAEMKGDSSLIDIPVLVVTIVDNQKDRGMIMGAQDYCVKPMRRRWLLDKWTRF
jgi:signal transduction histidine kinase/CheY-like chemotaxis protein